MEKAPTSPQSLEFEPEINVEGENFILFRKQRRGNSAIYRSEEHYLRIGDPIQIELDIDLHETMLSKGMPVPLIIGKGSYKNFTYYTEQSVGDEHFGKLFHEHYTAEAGVEQKFFNEFLEITKRYLEAQLTTIAGPADKDEVAEALGLERLCQKYPEQAEEIRVHFDKALERVDIFPSALTQGDFNAFNILPGGVIDLEFAFYGPLPYDAATVLSHHDNFAPFEGNELTTNYIFSSEQKRIYLTMVDDLYIERDLPPLSQYMKEFDFLRTVRSAAWVTKSVNLHNHIFKRLLTLMES